jgi:hypothetical protein
MNAMASLGVPASSHSIRGAAPILFVLLIAGAVLLSASPVAASNTLSVGTASGASGSTVSVPLDLSNQDVVKGLQTDIQFDAAVVEYQSIAATARVGTMAVSASVVGGNKVRVIGYYSDANTLAAGTGAIANLTFHLIGAGGTQTSLTPSGTLLSGPNQESWAVTAQAGSIQVTGTGPPPPVVKVAVLRNPARTRTIQILVSSDQDLVAAPTVTVDGTAVTATSVPQQGRIWQAAASLALDVPSVLVQATGSNGNQTGTAQVTVVF